MALTGLCGMIEQNKNIASWVEQEIVMRAVEDVIELASIGAFFVMMAVWAGVSTNWPLV